jgi:hypothetical protein
MGRTPRPLEYLVLAAVVVLALTWLAPRAWLTLLTDGLLVAAVVAAAAGWGAWPAAWLLGDYGAPADTALARSPELQAGTTPAARGRGLCAATALGLGVLAIVTLILGAAGWLNRATAWALVSGGLVLLLAHVIRTRGHVESRASAAAARGAGETLPAASADLSSPLLRCLFVLPLAPALTIGLLAACVPPGVLWEGEAGGYDVLEYHLQGPREYFDAGRIHFLPHNVYASFPQQMEMLYLLQMHLLRDVHAAAIPAQVLHLACGALAVLAIACWMPAGWPRIAATLLAGSAPWLTYVGALAYVENGVLFFAAVAAGLLAELASEKSWTAGVTPVPPRMGVTGGMPVLPKRPGQTGLRRALAAGACAGLAGGCKYTAMVLVAAALPLALVLASDRTWCRRIAQAALLMLGALLTAGPWLVRNAAFTGNPVYPFAFDVFGGKAWSASQAEQWARGHALPPEDSSVPGRAWIALRELLGDLSLNPPRLHAAYFGPVLVLLGVLGAARWRRHEVRLPTVWAGIMLLVWAGATHMPGRFAVPLIVPLALLAGYLFVSDPQPPGGRSSTRPGARGPSVRRATAARSFGLSTLGALAACSVLGGSVWNGVTIGRLWREHDHKLQQRTGGQVRLTDLLGMTGSVRDSHYLNQATPPGAHVWIVGDAAVFYVTRAMHYTVVFSRDPWLELAAGGTSPFTCVEWLRTQGVTHVLFSWSEIERLRGTYGFSPVVTREWVQQLTSAGLRRVEAAALAEVPAEVELYEVCTGRAAVASPFLRSASTEESSRPRAAGLRFIPR